MTAEKMTAEKISDSVAPTQAIAPRIPSGLQRIVLAGFMGAGKTTVGRILAQALGWEFLDLDAHLESRAAQSIANLFALHGEAHFRRLESSALANALQRPRTVIALGGGVPEQLTNRLLLEQTPGTAVVFLDAPFPVLYDRCMLQSIASPDHIRPVLSSPLEAQARFDTRQPIYRRIARLTISTIDLSPAQTSQSLLESLATLRPFAKLNGQTS